MKLHIENFGYHQDGEVEIGRLTVFAGVNGTMQLPLAQALTFYMWQPSDPGPWYSDYPLVGKNGDKAVVSVDGYRTEITCKEELAPKTRFRHREYYFKNKPKEGLPFLNCREIDVSLDPDLDTENEQLVRDRRFYFLDPEEMDRLGDPEAIENVVDPALFPHLKGKDELVICKYPEVFSSYNWDEGPMLHPRIQVQMAEHAVEIAKKARVVLLTHSDFVMLALRLAVKKGTLSPEDVVIHYFVRDGDEISRVSPQILEDGAVDIWPEGFFDQYDKMLVDLF